MPAHQNNPAITPKKPKQNPPGTKKRHTRLHTCEEKTNDGATVPLDAIRCNIHGCVQLLVVVLATTLLENLYPLFGKNESSLDKLMLVFPSSFGSDRRKPITQEFQQYGELIFQEIINTLLFGKEGWRSTKKHMLVAKLNTIKVSEDSDYYGKQAFHMHLDHKIGLIQPKNENQHRLVRFVVSFVKGAVDPITHAISESPEHLATVYLKDQPANPFANQAAFHKWMAGRYYDYGTANGNPRPIYIIPEDDVIRIKSGAVGVNESHPTGGQPVHGEANPVPDRFLYTVDSEDIIHGGKKPATRVPTAFIISLMKVLEDPSTELFRERIGETLQTAQELLTCDATQPILDLTEKHGGRQALNDAIASIAALHASLLD